MGLDQYFFVDPQRSGEKIEAAYIRKNNAVNAWVARYCEKKVENVEEVKLPRSAVELLLADIDKVLVAPAALGPIVMPTSEGFFFGSTDYDEYYVGKLEWAKS